MNTATQPKPIYQYSTDEIKEIVLAQIIGTRLTPGYYVDDETGNSLKIQLNTSPNRYQPYKYFIHFKHGFTEVVFSTDSLTERSVIS